VRYHYNVVDTTVPQAGDVADQGELIGLLKRKGDEGYELVGSTWMGSYVRYFFRRPLDAEAPAAPAAPDETLVRDLAVLVDAHRAILAALDDDSPAPAAFARIRTANARIGDVLGRRAGWSPDA
jgi:hypothetical protein